MKPSKKPSESSSGNRARDLIIAALGASLLTLVGENILGNRGVPKPEPSPKVEKVVIPVPEPTPTNEGEMNCEPYEEPQPECTAEELSQQEFDQMKIESPRIVTFTTGGTCDSQSFTYKDKGRKEKNVDLGRYPGQTDVYAIAQLLCEDVKLNVSHMLISNAGSERVEVIFICGKTRKEAGTMLMPGKGMTL